jgi:hypothetical protein
MEDTEATEESSFSQENVTALLKEVSVPVLPDA